MQAKRRQRTLDPMQAAEGSFNTKYPHEPNGIKDPEYSIQCGVQELKRLLPQQRWKVRQIWNISNLPCKATTSAMGILLGQKQITVDIPMPMQ